MEHEDIRRKLSAYLDNAVSVEEKAEIKTHLRNCGGCRGAIADLELTVGYLKTLPGVEPPPWLTAKIMAKVREIPDSGRSLLQRLFFPLRLKLPIEAFALVVICITGYYFARTVGVQAPLTTPSPTFQQAPAPPAPHPPASPQLPSVAAPRSGATVPRTAAPQSGTVPIPAAAQPHTVKSPDLEPAPSRPAEQSVEPELSPAEEMPNLEREAAPMLDKEEKGAPRDGAKKAKGTGGSEASYGTAQTIKGELALVVDDPGAATNAIEQAVNHLGGRISGHSYGEESHLLIVRIGIQKIPELIDRLGHIGTVQEKPQFPKGAGGTTYLTIRW